MQTKKTFWRVVTLLAIITVYCLIDNYNFWWSIAYFVGAFLVLFLFLFFRGAFRSSEQQEHVEHMLGYFPEEKKE